MEVPMRRFLYTLLGRRSPAVRTIRRPAPGARPALESLESRDVPSGFTTYRINYPPGYPAYIRAYPIFQITQPSPTMLAGKSVTLALTGTPSNLFGTLKITSLTQQADGSYTFTGTYYSYSYHPVDGMGQPATVSVTGTIGAPQYAGLATSTCAIQLDGDLPQATANVLGAPQSVEERVHFQGTVTLTATRATTSGQLYDCLEDPMTHEPIDPYCSTVPASGTFS
jgi:hypothetical protein